MNPCCEQACAGEREAIVALLEGESARLRHHLPPGQKLSEDEAAMVEILVDVLVDAIRERGRASVESAS